tara:strand:+ start:626 stop:1105 length:480 start_codon:yes stop_codon:yes gene_type:complete
MKLYEISSDMIALENLDLEPDQIADTMESLQMSFNDKAENIAALNETFTGNIESIDTQIKRLQAMKKTITNRQNQLKEYLRYNMIESGITKIDCPYFKISLRKAAKSVQVDDVDLLPDEFVTVTTVISANKNAIAKALKNGDEVSGATLVDGKQSLTIK